MLWECPKCEQKQSNPKMNHDHVLACTAVSKKPPLLGWQGVELDGEPTDRKGVPMSQKNEGWKRHLKG